MTIRKEKHKLHDFKLQQNMAWRDSKKYFFFSSKGGFELTIIIKKKKKEKRKLHNMIKRNTQTELYSETENGNWVSVN